MSRVCHARPRPAGHVEYPCAMSPIAVVLLAAAIVIVAACEWPRLSGRIGAPKRPSRVSKRRSKANLHVVTSDHEEFARSVERDLASLPTIDEQDAKRR